LDDGFDSLGKKALVRTKAPKQRICPSILIPSEPDGRMLMKIWIFAGLPTQSVTLANHI
jgi:hypothetical protein